MKYGENRLKKLKIEFFTFKNIEPQFNAIFIDFQR